MATSMPASSANITSSVTASPIRAGSKHFFMLTNRVISNLRAGYHRIMFGDQGIFMTRDLFERIGGFPETGHGSGDITGIR